MLPIALSPAGDSRVQTPLGPARERLEERIDVKCGRVVSLGVVAAGTARVWMQLASLQVRVGLLEERKPLRLGDEVADNPQCEAASRPTSRAGCRS